jgi:hypothetical protein
MKSPLGDRVRGRAGERETETAGSAQLAAGRIQKREGLRLHRGSEATGRGEEREIGGGGDGVRIPISESPSHPITRSYCAKA